MVPMKTRHIFLLVASAAAAAAFVPGASRGQDQSSNRTASRPQASTGTPTGGMLGNLRHGIWECALPGDAGGDAFLPQPDEAFRVLAASSYKTADGNGIYLLRGTEVLFTRGPKKDQRFRVLGENTVQKLNADGSLSKLICTRVSNGN
jgi:hypothetical protein